MKIEYLFSLALGLLTVSSCAIKTSRPANVSDRALQSVTSQNSLKAGLAEIDITPPIGHRMAGYFDERLATGIHDPLHAKAIV
ncbi:MAG: hypothetical protein M3Y82_11015, partial [Verrucomicrobiota bacterium]|nr:hypothetical protein [Verrucomicrobiota bacterium]